MKETWLCVNEDGGYVVFSVDPEEEYLDYVSFDDYVWVKARKHQEVLTIISYGVPVNERYFATNLQCLEPGEKIKLRR